MHIDALIDSILSVNLNEAPDSTFSIPASWGQGRTVYGGLSAAILYSAIKAQVADNRPMRSFNANFVGPIMVDTPFTIEVEVLREGKNATQVLGKIRQNGNVALICQVCFAVNRDSKVFVENTEQHQLEPPKKAHFIPPVPGVVPKFIRHLDLKLMEGRMPFTGGKKNIVKGWMRFKKAPERITDAHLIALIDAYPCPVLQTLRWPVPASTMNWNIEFLHPHDEIKPTDWLAYSSFPRQAADGYCHMESDIWDSQGKLIAISRQVVGVFD